MGFKQPHRALAASRQIAQISPGMGGEGAAQFGRVAGDFPGQEAAARLAGDQDSVAVDRKAPRRVEILNCEYP
jgi:hypothetical protein